MNTPPFGTPTWARQLHHELTEHTKEDRQLFRSLHDGQAELQVETGKQTVMLAELLEDRKARREVDAKRAGTEIETKAKIGVAWKTSALAALSAVLGWLVHHFM
jgi:hypothetical protein